MISTLKSGTACRAVTVNRGDTWKWNGLLGFLTHSQSNLLRERERERSR